jgi:hypothetical protein
MPPPWLTLALQDAPSIAGNEMEVKDPSILDKKGIWRYTPDTKAVP